MLKKNNIFLFIILILLICFCLFNRSIIENMDTSDCNKPSTITFSGKSKNKKNADHPHALLLTAKKTGEKNNCALGISSSYLPEITNSIKTKMAEQKS